MYAGFSHGGPELFPPHPPSPLVNSPTICLCLRVSALANDTFSHGGQALTAMRLMSNDKAVPLELTQQFEQAEIWLRPMRP